MRYILAIDSSEKCTGVAVLDTREPFESVVTALFTIPTNKKDTKDAKLVTIVDGLAEVLERFDFRGGYGDIVALENSLPVVERGRQMRGHIDGAIHYLAAKRGVPVHFLYGMSAWKLALGPASVPKKSAEKKLAIQLVMRELFCLAELPQEDASDALCIGMYAMLCGLCKYSKNCKSRLKGYEAVLECPSLAYTGGLDE